MCQQLEAVAAHFRHAADSAAPTDYVTNGVDRRTGDVADGASAARDDNAGGGNGVGRGVDAASRGCAAALVEVALFELFDRNDVGAALECCDAASQAAWAAADADRAEAVRTAALEVRRQQRHVGSVLRV